LPRPSPRVLDRFFVYHPSPWIDGDWSRTSGLPLQDIWFTAADGVRLFGWYVEPPRAHSVMLWCHGNAGNLIHRLGNLAHLYAAGFAVFVFDYRGYGRSEGRPSEAGLSRDAHAAYQQVRARGVRPERLLIFGRSLGAAVAGTLAASNPAAGLMLESCFPSVEAMARHHYYGLPLHWLLSSRFRLIDAIVAVHMPVLVIHGDQDDLVPLALGREVFEAARPPKSLYVIAGAGHNDTYAVGGRRYFERLVQFAAECVGR